MYLFLLFFWKNTYNLHLFYFYFLRRGLLLIVLQFSSDVFARKSKNSMMSLRVAACLQEVVWKKPSPSLFLFFWAKRHQFQTNIHYMLLQFLTMILLAFWCLLTESMISIMLRNSTLWFVHVLSNPHQRILFTSPSLPTKRGAGRVMGLPSHIRTLGHPC